MTGTVLPKKMHATCPVLTSGRSCFKRSFKMVTNINPSCELKYEVRLG